MDTNPSAPTGFLGVINNLATSASKVAETVSDVRAARGETQVVALPATATPANTTPGTVPGDVAEARANGGGPVAKPDWMKYAVPAGAILAAVVVVYLVAKRK